MIEKLILQTHITALQTVDLHFLLEGSGGFLKLYNLQEFQLLDTVDLFHGSRIHGIRSLPNHKDVVVFGGKQMALIELLNTSDSNHSKNNTRINVKKIWTESDWIKDAKLVDNGQFIAMLTSHNRVLVQKAFADPPERIEIQGSEQCILYSGQILGDRRSQLTILSGTVFGQILIWAASETEQQLFHRISGHNGVIFSVNFDSSSRTIVSTSDDRTIRTWALHSTKDDGNPFDEGLTDDLWKLFQRSQVVPKHQLYGHEARVWNSIVIRGTDGSVRIASLGEDSKICLWDFETGKLMSKLEAHPGASVWAADWNPHLNLLVSGGGDGATRIWSGNQLEEITSRPLQLAGIDQIPRLVAIMKGYVALTQQGVVYGRKPESDEWIKLFQDDRLKGGSVMDSDGRRVIIGTPSGVVFIFSISEELMIQDDVTLQLEGSKIYSALLVGSDQFLVSFDQGRMELRKLSHPETKAFFILPEGKQRWPGCALVTDQAAIIGDREGSLHLYSIGQETPRESFPHVHGKNGLTDVRADPSARDLYYSAGKDGRVGLWRLSSEMEQPKLELLSVTNTSLGWIARLCWINHQLVYLAFHSDRFVVWSSHQQRSLMQVPCGGGHRSWDFSVSSAQVTFLYVKDKVIHETRRPLDSVFQPVLPGRSGGHSKSVCRARFITFPCRRDQPLLLTGSEDTTVKLFRVNKDRSLDCITTIPKHVSSVRTLAVKELKDPKDSWLCVSAGGRAQLSVGLLTGSSLDGELHVVYRDVKSHFLRGWLHRAASKPWTAGPEEALLVPDPETRFMDVDVLDRGDGQFHIFAACSDAFLRVYVLSLEDRHLDLFQEIDFHHCCVLLVKVVEAAAAGRFFLISAGTDGRLAVWDATTWADDEEEEERQPTGCLSLHQSGINGLDCRWVHGSSSESGRLLVLTGGDDNALVLSHIDISWAPAGRGLQLVRQRQLFPHAAQISGVALLEGNLAVSVSLDQRLILWRVLEGEDEEDGGGGLEWLRATCCDVSDIQGLDSLDGGSRDVDPHRHLDVLVSVFGQGIQMLQVSNRLLAP